MKKYLCICLALFSLTACAQTEDKSDVSINLEQTEATTTEVDGESDEKPEYSRDDFLLYSPDGEAVVYLGMIKSEAEAQEKAFPEYFSSMNITYNTQNVIEDDGTVSDETVDYISLIDYQGSSEYLENEKGIRVGYDGASKPSSTAEEVIAAYRLDPENESIYIGNPEDDMYTIALYFSIGSSNNVNRIISAKDADISDIENVSGADYFIKFMIVEDKVEGIQMYRKKYVA
jgi:hypothetical protein